MGVGCRCKEAASHYQGPLIVIAIGIGFVAVGSVPVAITFAIKARNSATIIGVGFIGFGLLLVLPGVMWCIVRRILSFRCCSRKTRLRSDTEEIEPNHQVKSSSLQIIPSNILPISGAIKKFSLPHSDKEVELEQDGEDEVEFREYEDDPDQGIVCLTTR